MPKYLNTKQRRWLTEDWYSMWISKFDTPGSHLFKSVTKSRWIEIRIFCNKNFTKDNYEAIDNDLFTYRVSFKNKVDFNFLKLVFDL